MALYLAAELNGSGHQHACAGGGQPPAFAPSQSSHDAAPPRFKHVAGGLKQQENIAVGHAQNYDEDNRHA